MIDMRAPDFWNRPPGLCAHLLSPLASIYGALAAARLARPAPRAALPTIVVGGLTLGGDGKTPTALALARLVLRDGEHPAFLSRGCGRLRGSNAPLRVDFSNHSADDVGDEALMLASVAPTIVGADRAAGARLAAAEGATLIILDDGFHSRRLDPDLAVLVIDASHGSGSGLCPPAGPLRAPIAAQLARADVLVVVETPGATEAAFEIPMSSTRRSWRGRITPERTAANRLRGARVLVFAGVGRPEKFACSLKAIGAEIVERRWFADHHAYRRRELEALAAEARRFDARLVTTQKDAVRLGGTLDMETLPVSLSFANESEVASHLRTVLRDARHRRRKLARIDCRNATS